MVMPTSVKFLNYQISYMLAHEGQVVVKLAELFEPHKPKGSQELLVELASP